MIATGKLIYNLLSTNNNLKALVGTKIYPLVAPQDTLVPFVLYERNYQNEYNHDSYRSSSVFTITVIADTYSGSVDVAEAVNTAVNNYSGEVLGIRVLKILNTSGSEAYAEGLYIQKIEYQVQTCN